VRYHHGERLDLVEEIDETPDEQHELPTRDIIEQRDEYEGPRYGRFVKSKRS
jgi:hypothetical protein